MKDETIALYKETGVNQSVEEKTPEVGGLKSSDSQLISEAEAILNSNRRYAKYAIDETVAKALEELSSEDRKRISVRGYEIRREVGEGQGSTRRAYYGTQKIGNLEREIVLKIPKKEDQITSVTAQINTSKKNRDLQEALISGKLRHSHIVRTVDSFQLEDGRTVNAEDFIDGWSVRTAVKRTGSIKDREKLQRVFLPLIEAVEYAHKQGVLHRDITPNNVLIPSQGEGAVLTDWQNAAYKREIENVTIPTRGGTNCTHPLLLNSLLKGIPSSATERTDIYSLGAVLYEAITGDSAFDYSLVSNPDGKKITINGKELCVGLKSKGKNLDSIILEDHENRLNEAMKKVPKNLKKLLYGMMTTKKGKEIQTMMRVKEEFLEATKPGREEKLEKLIRYAKVAGLTLAGGFGGIMAAYLGIMMQSQPNVREPTLSDVLRSQSSIQAHSQRNWETASGIRNGLVRTEFDKYKQEIEKNLDKLTGSFYNTQRHVAESTGRTIDNRLTFALIRSVKLEDTSKLIFKETRHPNSLVPIEYVRSGMMKNYTDQANTNSNYMKREEIPWMWMQRYTQSGYCIGDSLEDVFAKAICSNEEIELARAKTQQDYLMKKLRDKGYVGPNGSIVRIGDIADPTNVTTFDYYPRFEREKSRRLVGGEVQIAIPGYSDRLDPAKKRIIDRAVLLYLMSDKEGNLNLNNYNANAIKGEEAK